MLVQQEWLDVASRQDSVHTGIAFVLAKPPPGGFSSIGLGRKFKASASYILHDYLMLDAGVGHFSSGGVMVRSGHDAPLTIAYFGINYRVKLYRSLER